MATLLVHACSTPGVALWGADDPEDSLGMSRFATYARESVLAYDLAAGQLNAGSGLPRTVHAGDLADEPGAEAPAPKVEKACLSAASL